MGSELFSNSALTDVRVWVLDRRIFQVIMMKTGIQRQEENISFLKRSVFQIIVSQNYQ